MVSKKQKSLKGYLSWYTKTVPIMKDKVSKHILA